MANDMRIKLDFFNHWKTQQLESELGADGLICLLRLWAYAAEYRHRGVLNNMSSQEIESVSRWHGEPNLFIETLIKKRFIKRSKKGLFSLHNWKIHQSWAYYAPERKLQAQKAAAKRWGVKDNKKCYQQCGQHATSNASSIKNATSNAVSNATSNAPSPTPIPNPSPKPKPLPFLEKKPKETFREKIDREEKKKADALADRMVVFNKKLAEEKRDKDCPDCQPESEKPANKILQHYRDWYQTNQMSIQTLMSNDKYRNALDGYSGVEFCKSHIKDLEMDIMLNPDKFLKYDYDKTGWMPMILGYLKLGMEKKQIGDYGLRSPTGVDEIPQSRERIDIDALLDRLVDA